MQVLRTHVAGVDVHKEVIVITAMVGNADQEPVITQFECRTFTDDLREAGVKLLDLGIKTVLCESTGVFWKPVFNVWKPMGIEVVVGNARHMKNIPGRKTDKIDSQWLATLHRYGLIRGSFIVGPVFQRMRLLSRHRTNLVDDQARIKNRVQKVLEDGNVKLSSVISDVFGKGGLNVLRGIAENILDPKQLTSLYDTRANRKEDILRALNHCLTMEHCFVIRELLKQYDDIHERIEEVDRELCEMVTPYSDLIVRLDEIPGIDMTTAIGILAEASNELSSFPDERKFAAWAGVAAGNCESAGKKKRVKTRKGNLHLRKILIQAAHGAKNKRGSFYRSKYNKLHYRLGSANKAKVAIANKLARVIFKVIRGEHFKDIGYMRGDPQEQKIRGLLHELRSLGLKIYHVNHQTITSERKLVIDPTGIIRVS
jgi:transposase